MPERNANFGGHSSHGFKETVCINCNKIMDSCRDKDCLEEARNIKNPRKNGVFYLLLV